MSKTINGRLADVLFAPTNLLTRIRNQEPQESFTFYETMVRQHLATGKVIDDKDNTLLQIRPIINIGKITIQDSSLTSGNTSPPLTVTKNSHTIPTLPNKH